MAGDRRASAIVPLQPVKAEFRARVWDRSTRMELWQRAELFLDLTAQHWLGDGPGQSQDKAQSLQVAAAHGRGAAACARHRDDASRGAASVGATYVHLRHAFIPRVFDPENPSRSGPTSGLPSSTATRRQPAPRTSWSGWVSSPRATSTSASSGRCFCGLAGPAVSLHR